MAVVLSDMRSIQATWSRLASNRLFSRGGFSASPLRSGACPGGESTSPSDGATSRCRRRLARVGTIRNYQSPATASMSHLTSRHHIKTGMSGPDLRVVDAVGPRAGRRPGCSVAYRFNTDTEPAHAIRVAVLPQRRFGNSAVRAGSWRVDGPRSTWASATIHASRAQTNSEAGPLSDAQFRDRLRPLLRDPCRAWPPLTTCSAMRRRCWKPFG